MPMSEARIIRFYLDPGLKQSAVAGQHNFLNKLAQAGRDAGFRIEFRPNSVAERAKSTARPGFSVWHMEEPTNARGVTVRRAYHYPFWGVEPTGERWNWHVARTAFDPAQVPRHQADHFAGFWRKRLFPDLAPRDDGFIYMPLQGRLLDHRSFQSMSPLAMIEQTLARDLRPIVATLHPKEAYGQDELAALEKLATQHSRLTVDMGRMDQYLPACSCVVTQNSSAAFNGFFFGKPAVLFARVDFHHIAANVSELGVKDAFDALRDMRPDFSGFLWWFWQQMSINAGRPEAEAQIKAALIRAGWPM